MPTQKEWQEAYDEAFAESLIPGRYQYLYAADALVLESWLDCPEDQRPDELPDGGEVQYFMDGFIADLDDEAGFSLWYEKGWAGLMQDKNGRLPHWHTWFYWARFHEDESEMDEHFVKQCHDRDMPLPQWYLDRQKEYEE